MPVVYREANQVQTAAGRALEWIQNVQKPGYRITLAYLQGAIFTKLSANY